MVGMKGRNVENKEEMDKIKERKLMIAIMSCVRHLQLAIICEILLHCERCNMNLIITMRRLGYIIIGKRSRKPNECI